MLHLKIESIWNIIYVNYVFEALQVDQTITNLLSSFSSSIRTS